MDKFIGINWGSSNFRAHLIDTTGQLLDTVSLPDGIAKLDRDGMINTLSKALDKWPKNIPVYTSGMIGSLSGWVEIPYIDRPAGIENIAGTLSGTKIGSISCQIVPGLSCIRSDGEPDIMRGEEIEIFGLVHSLPELAKGKHIIVLPGTHTKWVTLENGQVTEFFTCMNGELFDLLSEHGLLSAIIEAEALDTEGFLQGLEQGLNINNSLGRLLFSVRAKVICGQLSATAAASYMRGLLIGDEIADAARLYPEIQSQAKIHIVGSEAISKCYSCALIHKGLNPLWSNADVAGVAGYHILHQYLSKVKG